MAEATVVGGGLAGSEAAPSDPTASTKLALRSVVRRYGVLSGIAKLDAHIERFSRENVPERQTRRTSSMSC